jgi:hypothetical protein
MNWAFMILAAIFGNGVPTGMMTNIVPMPSLEKIRKDQTLVLFAFCVAEAGHHLQESVPLQADLATPVILEATASDSD